MKLLSDDTHAKYEVAPYIGAWIEIIKQMPLPYKQIVAPLVGEGIEICYY
ncbi:hypothetical protein [Bacillus cereus]|nr:hypothetical protein [Bacillus cereus]